MIGEEVKIDFNFRSLDKTELKLIIELKLIFGLTIDFGDLKLILIIDKTGPCSIVVCLYMYYNGPVLSIIKIDFKSPKSILTPQNQL